MSATKKREKWAFCQTTKQSSACSPCWPVFSRWTVKCWIVRPVIRCWKLSPPIIRPHQFCWLIRLECPQEESWVWSKKFRISSCLIWLFDLIVACSFADGEVVNTGELTSAVAMVWMNENSKCSSSKRVFFAIQKFSQWTSLANLLEPFEWSNRLDSNAVFEFKKAHSSILLLLQPRMGGRHLLKSSQDRKSRTPKLRLTSPMAVTIVSYDS